MLKIEFSGNLPTFSSNSIACVQDYMNQAGNALILCETAQDSIVSSVINDCKFACKEDVLDMFVFAGIIPCNAVNPVSIYNALKKAIKEGKRDAADYSPITFTYIKDKQKQSATIEYPAYMVLFRLFNRLKKRESDMKARQDEALSNVKSLHDAYILGKASAEQLGDAIEKADRLMVQDEAVNEARKTLVHKSILRRKNASYQELIVLSGDIAISADCDHTALLSCIMRGKGYINKADEREKIFTSPKKYNKPAKQSYKQKRVDRAKAFYASLEKMKQDCWSYKLQQEKEKREALSAKMAADSALLQAMAFDYNTIRDILQSIPPDGKTIKKDDLMKKVNHIRRLVCGK